MGMAICRKVHCECLGSVKSIDRVHPEMKGFVQGQVKDPIFDGDIQECSNREVQKDQVSSNPAKDGIFDKHPESANTGNGFVVTVQIDYVILCNHRVVLEVIEMKVHEWMVKDPVTVSKDQEVQDCVDLMKEYSIRHLPVVEDQKLVGLVTESDLREVSSASFIEDMTIESVMITKPITVSPDTDIEDAAKLIYYHKIGGLPVIDNDEEVVGIITVVDLLEVFIELMGVMKSSSRIDVILGDEPEAFERVSALIRGEGGEIISVGISGDDSKTERIYFFRLEKCDVEHITGTLQDAGFEVVSSAA